MSDALLPKFSLPLDAEKLPESVRKYLLSKALTGANAQQVVIDSLVKAAAKAGFKPDRRKPARRKPAA